MSLSGTKQFVFIIGSTRSGTSWLHQMLLEHPAIAGIKQELSVFSNYVPPLVRAYEQESINERHLNHGLPVLVPSQEFKEWISRTVEVLYERVTLQRPEATHVLDKRPDYSRHMPVIEQFIPNAKYVHLIRDGREVAISMRSAGKRVGGFTDDMHTAAREWARSVRMGMASGATVGPDRYLEVRYEQLMENTAKELMRIFRFLGLAFDPVDVERIATDHHSSRKLVSKGDASLNELRGRKDAIWKSGLTLKERYIIDRTAGALLRSLGYAEQGWWALSPADKRRMWWHMFKQKAGRSVRAVRDIWTNPEYKPA